MNYIGSKKKLLPFLEKSITEIVGEQHYTFLDLFAGTGIVGAHFKKLGKTVVSNDMMYFSYVLNQNYIQNSKPLEFNSLLKSIPELKKKSIQERQHAVCNFLENLTPIEGYFYQNYCMGGTQKSEHIRNYYSNQNGMLLDAIRQRIEEWKETNIITENEYYFLLASLLESIDKVANTASVYGAYLKHLKKSAQRPLKMIPAEFQISQLPHRVYNLDIEKVLEIEKGDVLYLDPPYNHRQYAPNYHLLETIAKMDYPKIKGKTGLRDYSSQKSLFCQKKTVIEALKRVVMKADVKYIFVSYNNEGLLSESEIKNILSTRGKYGIFKQKYSRFKADKDQNRTHNADSVEEWLHYVVCG